MLNARLFTYLFIYFTYCHQVDGQSLLGTSHQEAVRALQNLSSTVTLLICDGYNDRNMTAGKPVTGLSTQVCISPD